MIHASLFSGIGGPEVAAAMLGWKNAFHCEINPFGKGVLDYWFPNSESYEDITKTDFTKWYGRIDVLTGGFPCQPFSYAGKRGGREDERYLWPEMLRVIQEVRPTWVVGENVAGITTMVEGRVLTELGEEASLFAEGDDILRYELIQSFTIERICSDLEHIGYSVQPMLIPAAAVGAPHRRDRVFIIAHVADADCRNDEGRTGEDEGKGKGKGIQERYSIRESREPDKLRPAVQGSIENSICDGSCIGANAEQRDQRDIWDASAGNSERLCGEKRADSTNSDCRRGGEVPTQIHTRVADGDEPFGNGREWIVTYSNCSGREESLFHGWEADSKETGSWVHDRTERLGGDGNTSYTVGKGPEGEDESGDSEGGERMRVRGDSPGYDWAFDAGLLPENRWRFFPTVSPVHRGNDGIPIRLDDLAISFTKWRTESLKAYGNAIVPQVMYRIFQAIEQIEHK